jgi:FtsH-binding integral membrane protein
VPLLSVPSASAPVLTPAVRAVAVMGWVTAVLVLDSDGSLALQRLLGVVTWALLALALRAEPLPVRVQTAVVVVFASAVEYTFAPLLGAYTYRFDNVPAYVPPGHGLVYLAALCLGRTELVQRHLRACMAAVVVVGGAYALYGVTLAERLDVLGLFWFGCLVGFLAWGPSQPLYVGAFVVVTYLELAGTRLGTWEWAQRSPFDLVPMGNPPSGAAGGYGWFDLAALLLAPRILHWWTGRRSTPQDMFESR